MKFGWEFETGKASLNHYYQQYFTEKWIWILRRCEKNSLEYYSRVTRIFWYEYIKYHYYCYGPGMSDCTSKLSDYEPDVDYPRFLELTELTRLRKRRRRFDPLFQKRCCPE